MICLGYLCMEQTWNTAEVLSCDCELRMALVHYFLCLCLLSLQTHLEQSMAVIAIKMYNYETYGMGWIVQLNEWQRLGRLEFCPREGFCSVLTCPDRLCLIELPNWWVPATLPRARNCCPELPRLNERSFTPVSHVSMTYYLSTRTTLRSPCLQNYSSFIEGGPKSEDYSDLLLGSVPLLCVRFTCLKDPEGSM